MSNPKTTCLVFAASGIIYRFRKSPTGSPQAIPAKEITPAQKVEQLPPLKPDPIIVKPLKAIQVLPSSPRPKEGLKGAEKFAAQANELLKTIKEDLPGKGRFATLHVLLKIRFLGDALPNELEPEHAAELYSFDTIREQFLKGKKLDIDEKRIAENYELIFRYDFDPHELTIMSACLTSLNGKVGKVGKLEKPILTEQFFDEATSQWEKR